MLNKAQFANYGQSLASLQKKFDTFVDSANSDVTVGDIKTKLNELHSDFIELSSRPPVESNLNTDSVLKSIGEQIKVLSTRIRHQGATCKYKPTNSQT